MKMTLRLSAPGMTSLHKAGLAGLYLTLRAFEEKGEQIAGLVWELAPTQIVLDWQNETPKAAFEELVAKSFRLEDGFIGLTGLEIARPLSIAQRHLLNFALQNSFLQFGPDNPTGSPQTLSYEVDDHQFWIKNFKPILRIRPHKAVQDFIDEEGKFKSLVEAAGWLYPGGGHRHAIHKATKLNEPIESAFVLLFASVGVIYYTLKSRVRGRKARLAMLVPEISDLELYVEVRQAIAEQSVLELTASSASDAALRMLTTITANQTSNQFADGLGGSFVCRVMTFGIVSWNEKQKTRTYAHSVFSGRLIGFENYRVAAAIFKNHWQKSKEEQKGKKQEKKESYFIASPTARELIADNIAQGRAWFHNFTTFLDQKEVRKGLLYERKELFQMIEKASFEDENERIFISVCHISWRRRMSKLAERASKEGADRGRLIQKEFERLRTSISRSRNAHNLRETIVDWWARAGTNQELQGEGLSKLLPLFNEKNWKKARDLALLALISYQPKDKQEAVDMAAIQPAETSIEEGESTNE